MAADAVNRSTAEIASAAWAPVSPIVTYWVRSVHPAEPRRPNGQATCTSPGGRSEFLANTMPDGPGAHSVSHMVEVY